MKRTRDEVSTGRIGELIAAGIIEELGWQTAFCQQNGVDIICWKDNTFYRCQVKSSTFHRDTRGRLQFHFGMGGKKRRPTPKDYDFACLVSVPQRKAYFMPIQKINQLSMSRNKGFFENPTLEQDSFEKTIRWLDEFYRKIGRPTD